ncbi:tetratricopeptide repeat protein [Paenibacillus tengchongensis]|uniref:tetratricopeptide repeat protein n=1 Tax=Paenibacillus tengchongensis TaxID=2608684 RepID=UPI00124E1CBA|nr:tetratricopeptide repeat protein [Paenibacillus tengchongensis]
MTELTSEKDTDHGNVVPITLDANFFFERAVRSLDRFQYDKALRNFRKAVEYEPENPVNHCNLAGILSEMGDYEASNDILRHVLDKIEPGMTECHFYMANNFANMDNFEAAEQSLVTYLEEDANGEYLVESEELMELLQYELDRPAPLVRIRSREGVVEHERARRLLEEGKFQQAVKLLEEILDTSPDFLAARNNLALAYFYMGHFAKSRECLSEVLEQDPGNLHALCNMAILLQYAGDKEQLAVLVSMLETTVPFHQEHVFKMATTMGILGRHRIAYSHFRRLLKEAEAAGDASLHHYCAAAASNSGLYDEALHCWRQAARLDPASPVPSFFLTQLQAAGKAGQPMPAISYNYQLPFQEQLKQWAESPDTLAREVQSNPLLRASFFWALRYGDSDTQRQVTEALRWIGNSGTAEMLRKLMEQEPSLEEGLPETALLSLQRLIGGPEGEDVSAAEQERLPLPPKGALEWKEEWQRIIDQTTTMMDRRFDAHQKKAAELLWQRFVDRLQPDVPPFRHTQGWSAALEYRVAKLYGRPVTYREIAQRYSVTVSMVSRYVRRIEEICETFDDLSGLGIFPSSTEKI